MKRVIIGLLLGLLLAAFSAIPVLAYLTAPNITINSVKCFRNLAETGDMLVVFHTTLDTGSSANSTPASSTILFKLISTNGTVQKTATPYVYSPFETGGYGNVVGSFYFTAADLPVWGEAYSVNVTGLPAYYDPIPMVGYTIQASDYSSASDQKGELYTEIIRLADLFHILYPDVTLKSTTDVGTVLSSYGEAYFKAVIPGLLYLCPQLFYIQVITPTTMAVTAYDMSKAATYAGRLAGSDLERGPERLGVMIGLSGDFVWAILVFALCMFINIKTHQMGWDVYPGIIMSFAIVVCAALLIGTWAFTLMMVVSLAAIIAIMWIFVLRRA